LDDSQLKARDNTTHSPVYSKGLDRDREAISENATRNLFGWLRRDGHAREEADIWKHEWFDSSDSDEDEASGDENASNASHQLSDRVMTWIAHLRAEDEIFDSEIPDGYRFWPNSAFGFDQIGGDYIMDGERLHESEAKEPTRALHM
jgi:hypothetical protein